MVINLANALHCIRYMESKGIYRDQKVGRMTRAVGTGDSPPYSKGEVVLYMEQFDYSQGARRIPLGIAVVERPLTRRELLDPQRQREMADTGNGPIATRDSTPGVPLAFIEEIVLKDSSQ